MAKQKRNPQDATLRNIRALKKVCAYLSLGLEGLELRVRALEGKRGRKR